MNIDRTVTRENGPFFNSQPLKLGILFTNIGPTPLMSTIETGYEASWDYSLRVARLADEIGLDALLTGARWVGYGGPTQWQSRTFEVTTYAAAVAAVTKNLLVVSTIIAPTMHPVHVAKAITTIDHISGGRAGLNMVMGWNPGDMNAFGLTIASHADRYAYGQEWIDIIKQIWESDESFDYDGKFFQLKGVEGDPKPVQQHPVLINAGASEAGIDFSVRNVDLNFTGFLSEEEGRRHVAELGQRAAKYGRDKVGAFTQALVITRDTEEEAQAVYEELLDKIDWEAVRNYERNYGAASEGELAKSDKDRREMAKFAIGGGAPALVGTPEQVAEGFQTFRDAGLDAALILMVDYAAELPYFAEKVLPLLKERGLRV